MLSTHYFGYLYTTSLFWRTSIYCILSTSSWSVVHILFAPPVQCVKSLKIAQRTKDYKSTINEFAWLCIAIKSTFFVFFLQCQPSSIMATQSQKKTLILGNYTTTFFEPLAHWTVAHFSCKIDRLPSQGHFSSNDFSSSRTCMYVGHHHYSEIRGLRST